MTLQLRPGSSTRGIGNSERTINAELETTRPATPNVEAPAGVAVVPFAQQKAPGAHDDPNQWVMPNANQSGWNYSPLNQINLDNVKNLAVAWTLPLAITDSFEASPLVIGDTMYIVTPKPNYLY